jgi:hypothetical protein
MTAKYLGLVHYPIKNKRDELVRTSVTNLDIHDIARSCRTFGFKNYHIITPIQKQQELIGEILGFWNQDQANDYNPDRQDALSYIYVSESIENSITKITEIEGKKPLIAVTGANFASNNGSIDDLSKKCAELDVPLFLLFGTGWGLHDQALELADFSVVPIFGKAPDGYNHLSVRSAVAIYLSQF